MKKHTLKRAYMKGHDVLDATGPLGAIAAVLATGTLICTATTPTIETVQGSAASPAAFIEAAETTRLQGLITETISLRTLEAQAAGRLADIEMARVTRSGEQTEQALRTARSAWDAANETARQSDLTLNATMLLATPASEAGIKNLIDGLSKEERGYLPAQTRDLGSSAAWLSECRAELNEGANENRLLESRIEYVSSCAANDSSSATSLQILGTGLGGLFGGLIGFGLLYSGSQSLSNSFSRAIRKEAEEREKQAEKERQAAQVKPPEAPATIKSEDQKKLNL